MSRTNRKIPDINKDTFFLLKKDYNKYYKHKPSKTFKNYEIQDIMKKTHTFSF